MMEDVIVTLDSLDFPSDFVVLSPKGTLGVYQLILGRSWLAIVDVCIACQSRKMTISDGAKTKKLTLYSPVQPQLDLDQVSWPDLGDDLPEVNPIQQLKMLEGNPFFVSQEEDDILAAILTN